MQPARATWQELQACAQAVTHLCMGMDTAQHVIMGRALQSAAAAGWAPEVLRGPLTESVDTSVVMPKRAASSPARVDLPVPEVPASRMQMLRRRSCTLHRPAAQCTGPAWVALPGCIKLRTPAGGLQVLRAEQPRPVQRYVALDEGVECCAADADIPTGPQGRLAADLVEDALAGLQGCYR